MPNAAGSRTRRFMRVTAKSKSVTFGSALLLSVAALIGVQVGAASADPPPVMNGYPSFSPITITPHCTTGVLTSITVSFTWSAVNVQGSIPAQNVLAGPIPDDVSDPVQAGPTLTMTAGQTGSYSHDFTFAASSRTGVIADIEALAPNAFVWAVSQRDLNCTADPAVTAPTVTGSTVNCDGSVDINYDNTSSDDWDSVIFDQNGVGTTLATISANSTATVNVPSPGTLMIVGAQLSNQIRPGVTALTTFGSVSVAVPGSCTPPTNVDTLAVGELLASGQFKHDIGNAYSLVMQPDGNLVEYSAAGAVWSSATSGHPGAFAALQADGNFVIYNQAGTQALWASNHFSGAVASLVVQGDGNVVEYTGGGAPIWYTGVPIAPVTGDTLFPNSAPQKLLVGQALHSASGGYVLVMQSDGNLVAYSPTKAIWSSSTSGAGASFVMQTDGNAVLYSNGKPVWSTGTYGHPGSVLVMQPDGNVVVYSPSGQPLWASGLPH